MRAERLKGGPRKKTIAPKKIPLCDDMKRVTDFCDQRISFLEIFEIGFEIS